MNENIDARIANYIAILQNKELANLLGKDVYYKIQEAIGIYVATTSKEMIDEYKRKQEAQARVDEVSRLFK